MFWTRCKLKALSQVQSNYTPNPMYSLVKWTWILQNSGCIRHQLQLYLKTVFNSPVLFILTLNQFSCCPHIFWWYTRCLYKQSITLNWRYSCWRELSHFQSYYLKWSADSVIGHCKNLELVNIFKVLSTTISNKQFLKNERLDIAAHFCDRTWNMQQILWLQNYRIHEWSPTYSFAFYSIHTKNAC